MDLFATPGSPVPSDGIISAARTADGLTLRVARWPGPPNALGTVVVAPGRSEFIETYFEVVAELRARRFHVVVMDWRGQGESDREIPRRRRGHIRHFDHYKRDLAALEAQILRPFAPRPWFALGHSMGASILLDQAHDGTSPFERIVLSAPMIDLPLRFRGQIEVISRMASVLGLGKRLVPGGSEDSVFLRGYEGNPLTSDRGRYERVSAVIQTQRHLVVGAPTIGWLHAAFGLMARFQNPRFAMETLTPILIIAAGADTIVDTRATERFAARLKTGRCLTIAAARHEILRERDPIRAQFWAAFDAFVPGDAEDRARFDQRTTTLVPTGTR